MIPSFKHFVMLVPLFALAQEAADTVAEKRAKLVQERTKEIIKTLREQETTQTSFLQRLKKGIIDKNAKGTTVPANPKERITFASKEVKKQALFDAEAELAETQARIKKYRNGSDYYYGTLKYPPKIADFGNVYPIEMKVNVKQVIDGNTMLINVYYVSNSQTEGIILMVKNVSTKGVTDGAGINLPHVFEVVDTQTYKTATGSNTVFVIEPLDTKSIENLLTK